MLTQAFNDLVFSFLRLERRFDPFFRPLFAATLREPLTRMVEFLINLRRSDGGLKIAEEKALAGEEAALDSIIESMSAYMRQHYQPGHYERAGNTKTHGIVRGEVTIRDDLPAAMRRGLFVEPRSYRAWVRFGGPGPNSPPDIDDAGVLSIAVKVMEVPGPKLIEDERFTQDFFGISTPTFITPDVVSNAQLQAWILKGTPIFYFFNRHHTHLLDMLMQGLWSETQRNPLEQQYYSCVPYLLGEGQAMKYSVRSRLNTRSRIPRLPLRPPDNYLREAMVATLAQQDVEFDILLQLQTDPVRMPIENAAVRWRSPFVPAATLWLPRQKFDSPAQLAFANNLSYNPWHCLPEHRPLGNQNRVRRRMYLTLSTLRQNMNKAPHIEPTGNEVFE